VTPLERTGPVSLSSASAGSTGLLDELAWRGLLHAATPGLAERLLDPRPVSGYIGFDPTGPSLHVGHLVPIFGLLHLQRHGGRPVALMGGGTGMIGDPSGTSAERNLLTREMVVANTAAIRAQLEHFLDFEGPTGAVIEDNHAWLGSLKLLDFLRDVGKHFTIPYMLAKESVATRLEAGLSYTEFSYMLLQATDFLQLHRTLGVELQMGGADQWGNITAGLELIRRVEGRTDDPEDGGAGGGADRAHGLSYPLLLDASGKKFGKTAEGTSVWLDPQRTSPFAFYQFWLDRDDAETGKLLRMFTLRDRPQIEALEASAAAAPEARIGQRALASDLTERVHGAEVLRRVIDVSEAVFSRTLPSLGPEALAFAFEQLPNAVVGADAVAGGPIALAVAAGLFGSNGEARRTISQGGLSINEIRVASVDAPVPATLSGGYLVLRSGKKAYVIVKVTPAP
jgi:tyrosyl-tRNA synthetase